MGALRCALDKTQVDTYGRLQMEPMTISHKLIKHSARSHHTAMQILGYICHGPAHKPNFKDGKVIIRDQPLDLPTGTGCYWSSHTEPDPKRELGHISPQ